MASPETLIEATLASSAAIALVLALRRPLRKAFGARVAYGAWGVVPAAIAAVLLPAAKVAPAAGLIVAMPHALAAVVQPDLGGVDRQWLPAAVWIAGAIACAVAMGTRQWRFRRGLGRLVRRADGLREAERDSDGLPATLGLWSPQVVVPPAFDTRYDTVQRDLMLAHERAHLRRGDVQANALLAALRCLFWFNPLLHLAAPRFRQDQELACDATVLAAFPQARRRYGEALLHVQLTAQATPLGCHFGFGHPLRERIAMLKEQLPSTSRRVLGTALMSVLALGCGFGAWAAQSPRDGAEPEVKRPVAGQSLPPPEYPEYAFEHDLGGLVVLRVDVAADGSVDKAIVERSEPKGIFDEAALAAVKQWKFNPSLKDGKPVSGQVRVPIEFKVDPKAGDEAMPMKTGPDDPDPAAYDWVKVDLSTATAATDCDVVKGNIAESVMWCGNLRK